MYVIYCMNMHIWKSCANSSRLWCDRILSNGEKSKTVKLIGKGFLNLVEWSLSLCSAKQATAVRELKCLLKGISSEDWEQRRRQSCCSTAPTALVSSCQLDGILASCNGPERRRLCCWWLVGAPEVLADWWPAVLCVEPAVAGQKFSGAVILEWKLFSHECVHQDCLLSRVTYAGIRWMCNTYADICTVKLEIWKHMQTYADICRKFAKICSQIHANTCIMYPVICTSMQIIAANMQSYASYKRLYAPLHKYAVLYAILCTSSCNFMHLYAYMCLYVQPLHNMHIFD